MKQQPQDDATGGTPAAGAGAGGCEPSPGSRRTARPKAKAKAPAGTEAKPKRKQAAGTKRKRVAKADSTRAAGPAAANDHSARGRGPTKAPPASRPVRAPTAAVTADPPATTPVDPVVAQLLERMAAAPGFSKRLDALASRTGRARSSRPIRFDGVGRAAVPAVLALIRRHWPADRRIWVVCGDPRQQENLDAGLILWGVSPRFLPALDFERRLDVIPDPDIVAERLGVVQGLLAEAPAPDSVLLVAEDSLDDSVPDPTSLRQGLLSVAEGQLLDPVQLAADLEQAGFRRAGQVAARGEFAVRGGLLDVFAWGDELPLRIEWFGDEIESLRRFDLHSQTSVERCRSAGLLLRLTQDEGGSSPLRDWIGTGDLVVAVDCAEHGAAGAVIDSGPLLGKAADSVDSVVSFENPLGVFAAGDLVLQEAKRASFLDQVRAWHGDGWRVAVFFAKPAERERFGEIVPAGALPDGALELRDGAVAEGFSVPPARLVVLSGSELFGRYHPARARRLQRHEQRQRQARRQVSVKELVVDELVVHADYGVARYRGLHRREQGLSAGEEVLELEYADEARLYVPLSQAHLVSRYVGAGGVDPPLGKLGGGQWNRIRRKAEAAIEDYAAGLLKMQAEREVLEARAHPPDTPWQREFEESFPFRETPDQLRAVEEIKRDMELLQPMDRLLCGDVGFGKTEVAIRAAFKCVMGGRQCAVLVPTTVLAQQHFETFSERMSEYPVRVAVLSRYVKPAEQRRTLAGLLNGSVDIVIGTHRLVSKDVAFKDLGLVVIDEEQRFGVKHKERFKQMFLLIDVLTLSATPIPRTLYLSLMGARDMSTLETPPPSRYPVHTTVCAHEDKVIRDAVRRELKRGGQVFFLHNRVATIGMVRRQLEGLVPEARVVVGHGQMDNGVLEGVMHRFIRGEADVLISTTIIESGVDIPNANTIIIDRADMFGLADLYQLRGRVGRGTHKAYALLLLPRDAMATGEARRRVQAIQQYTALGSGFRIAMRDLELRGAGNLLGTEQSGHIAAVGFDLYCKLLRQSVERLQGRVVGPRADVSLRLDWVQTSESEWLADPHERLPAFIPQAYMTEPVQRILGYRNLAEAAAVKELNGLRRDWRDRFGRVPEPVENLLMVNEIRVRAAHAGISSVEIPDQRLMLMRNGGYLQVDGRFPRLTGKTLVARLKETLELMKKLS